MKIISLLTGVAYLGFALSARSADPVGDDPLTKLPLPTTGAPLTLFGNPHKIDDVPVCKSKGTMNMYSGHTGNVSDAIYWYASHLAGFKRVHGFGSGRSQDTFYNPAGTLMVSITGHPGKEGQDTKVYSVIYSTIQPGASEKVIAGMNIQKVVCP
jgi:hypothetical protein